MSDWEGYAKPLAEKFNYTNTFYHTEPKLDIVNIESHVLEKYDFLISSDVFEHIPPPVSIAFDNTLRLLKSDGYFIFTVPYQKQIETTEHFPDLYDFHLVETNGKKFLFNTTQTGQEQIFDQLVFHGGDGFTLEMRVFGEASLLEELSKVGFSDIQIYNQNIEEFGIIWEIDWAMPIVAKKT